MHYEPVEIEGVKSVRIIEISKEGIDAEIQIAINNPNKFSFSITDYDLDIRMMNMNIGKAKLKDKVKIQPNGTQTYAFRVQTSFGQMLAVGLPMLLSGGLKKDTRVEAKGFVKVRHMGVSKRIEVDLEDTVKLLK